MSAISSGHFSKSPEEKMRDVTGILAARGLQRCCLWLVLLSMGKADDHCCKKSFGKSEGMRQFLWPVLTLF